MSEQEQPKFFSVAEISRSKAYELICADNWPFTAVKIGKRICIPANSFYKWYESMAGNENE